MKNAGSLGVRFMLWGLALAIAGIAVLGPTNAQADEVTAQTLQLLPPGSQTCAAPTVSGFISYVYGNNLNSFEFTISDPSYVAILGSLEGTPIPFRLMTRLNASGGGLRVHVDTPSMPIRDSLEVTVTMLSPGGSGKPTCALTVRALIPSSVVAPGSGSTPTTPATPAAPSAPSTGTMKPEVPAGSTTATGTGTLGTSKGTGGACPVQNVPALWVILLALYAMLVASLVLGDKRPYLDVGPQALLTLVVVPFIGIVAVWYGYAACRVDWAPFAAFAIGAVGLAAAYKNDPNLFKSLGQS
jgi:hypothetical protein